MQEFDHLKKKTIFGMIWSFAERIGAQLVSFVVSIVLARLLMPEEYGIIAIVWVFISLGNVFVNSGFGRALVQKKDTDELDFSSVFWFSLAMSLVLYGLLFAAAPWIAGYYQMEMLRPVLRVMGLRMVLASLNTVQHAWVSRQMQFKKFFFSTLGGTIFSAVAGITMAYSGFGVWTLVFQELINVLCGSIILLITIPWRPRLMFSLQRMKGLFRFGWKVLLSGLLDTGYEEFRSLYVGKLYSVQDLAYYAKGKQFPYLIIDNMTASISDVLFPAISSAQDDLKTIQVMARRSMKISSYILFPMLMGLAAVAEPMVELILTEKWLPSVPFLRILCVDCALTVMQTTNMQAINAVGRSDVALNLNVIKKAVGFCLIFLFGRISVYALACASVAAGVLGLLSNMVMNKKLIGYSIRAQLQDIVPHGLLSAVMYGAVVSVSVLNLPLLPELLVMVLAGAGSYVALSVVLKVDSFRYIWNLLKPVLQKLKK